MRKLSALVMICVLPGIVSSALASETVTYSYDQLGRLTKVSRSGGPASGSTVDLTHDAMANRTRVVSVKGQQSSGGGCGFRIHDAEGNSEFSFGVPVQRIGTCSANVTVNYDDGFGRTGQLTFAPSDEYRYINIPGSGSNCYDASVTATITIAAGPGYIERGAATVTVVSNC